MHDDTGKFWHSCNNPKMASPHFIFYWWQSFDLRIALPKQFCQPMWTVRLDTSWQFLNARFIKQGEVWWQCRCNHIGVCETVWSTGESKKREISTCNLSICPYAGNIHCERPWAIFKITYCVCGFSWTTKSDIWQSTLLSSVFL